MIRKILKTAALSAVVAAAPSYALESDRSKPIEIEADQGTLDQKNQTTTFSGNVVIKQGTMYIRAGSVTVSKDANGNQFMKAGGSPVKFGQQLEKGGKVDGQANNVEYASDTGVVRLVGNAKVTRGGDKAEGESIVYNTRTEVYTVSGSKAVSGKSGKRVTVVIQPTKK
ncbi:lipopolysaccharide transport periplasmic protein LptA [Neisseria canis]|uniref:Lipopolysaccharide export system protein LptA n=1 Tax=Neisseria canis TaxID=493 RepID=A0A1X3D0G0_9NEIS|nr:lipopolysaccharide transport periplasmic protein LptA [Neisseria canis]OSI13358.1 lipopolysaccharide transport periplasmic protein LptA [Neisseria canis]VEE99313.1 lipopolysaccharide ABC transporter, periplasmic lipopolysaccharide-binding protein [Neisseria canis]